MGDIFVDVAVANDAAPSRRATVKFLVDTGATWSWIPRPVAKALGIRAAGSKRVVLADGRTARLPYGLCKFIYRGEMVNGTVILGGASTEPLLGVHVLQDFCLDLDLDRHRVRRRGALRAAGFRLR